MKALTFAGGNRQVGTYLTLDRLKLIMHVVFYYVLHFYFQCEHAGMNFSSGFYLTVDRRLETGTSWQIEDGPEDKEDC